MLFEETYQHLLDSIGVPSIPADATLSSISRIYGEKKLVELIETTAHHLGVVLPTSMYSDWDKIDLEYVTEVLVDLVEKKDDVVEVDLLPPVDICCMLGKCWIGECR